MIDDHKSMESMTPEQQATKALRHLLVQIRERSEVGWYLGFGTESFALATEAYATLTGKSPLEIRQVYAPRDPKNPRDEVQE